MISDEDIEFMAAYVKMNPSHINTVEFSDWIRANKAAVNDWGGRRERAAAVARRAKRDMENYDASG